MLPGGWWRTREGIMTESRKDQKGMTGTLLSATLAGMIVFSILSGVSAAPEPATVEGVTFSREVRAGDSTLPLGTVAGEDFAVGLFGTWIGANPLDSDLKRLLLGE
jgi:Chalcone isomerase-like